MTKPGEVFQYSNFGYGLLGYAIERVTKTSYSEFLQSRMFEPLGMKNSFVASEPPPPGHSATRYSMDGQVIPSMGSITLEPLQCTRVPSTW